jgi:hypothetical protein
MAPDTFGEAVDAVEDSLLSLLDEAGSALGPARHPPTQIELWRGQTTRYEILGAYCRTIGEAERLFGTRWAPFAWQGLMNRYHSKRLRLEIRARGGALRGAFASQTDLGTGLQQPLRLAPGSDEDVVRIEYENCPPRRLIRVYWPLLPT